MRRMLFVFLSCLVAGAAFGAGPDTHVGQPASQLVTLYGQCDAALSFPCKDALLRMSSEGKLQACLSGREEPLRCEYTVPDGSVLIVTDVDWKFESTGPANAGFFLYYAKGQATGLTAYESAIHINAGEGEGEHHSPFTTGFVVGPKGSLRAGYFPGQPQNFWRFQVWVRGYLVADK